MPSPLELHHAVRFVRPSKYMLQVDHLLPPRPCSRSRRNNSRFGCWECRARKVKCDETHPVCIRCQRRGSVCLSSPRPARWQTQTSLLTQPAPSSSWPQGAIPNNRLLQYWLEQASHLLSLFHNSNPLSFPLLQYLPTCASLIHAVQSISAGHEGFFQGSHLDACLEERGRALHLVSRELSRDPSPSTASVISIFLLGVSSPWIESKPESFGQEHLDGARSLLKLILANDKMRHDSFAKFLMGWYLYWDMACALFSDPKPGRSLDLESTDVILFLDNEPRLLHPISGFSSELYALISSIARYCRQVIDAQARNPAWETQVERKLLAWCDIDSDESLRLLSQAFQNHGLLMLYRVCDSCPHLHEQDDEDSLQNRDAFIRQLALETVVTLLSIPVSESHAIFQSMPLLTAASELSTDDQSLRDEVIIRFKGLYSTTRVRTNLWPIDILNTAWEFKDIGVTISWMELCLSQGWKICFT